MDHAIRDIDFGCLRDMALSEERLFLAGSKHNGSIGQYFWEYNIADRSLAELKISSNALVI